MKRKHSRNSHSTPAPTAGKSVAIIGAGGTIGSHLIPHIARMKQVSDVLLIEPDRYEPHNLVSQDIEARDIGRLKVEVQARRLKRIDPLKTVRPFAERVENVPIGTLRCDVILACLDSRKVRMAVSEMAYRLGVPWLDAGIDGEDWIARVNGYGPGNDVCMECAWNEDDYGAVEQIYPCDAGVNHVFRTNSPSHLGALAASIQAAECEKILAANQGEQNLLGRQIVVDLRNQGQIVSRFTRNPGCRFDHQQWDISPLEISSRTCVRDVFSELGGPGVDFEHASLELAGHSFAQTLVCSDCQQETSRSLRIVGRLNARGWKCSVCEGQMITRGFDQFERVGMYQLSESEQRKSLRSIGFREGDVLQVFLGDVLHWVELKKKHELEVTLR